jgi:putative ABC transport system permease protein
MLFTLAWKNVWRNRKRSTILFIAIMTGLWCGLLASALFFGMWEATINSTIDRELSHIQIHQPGFREERTINNFINNTAQIRNILTRENNVEGYSFRTIIDGMASSPVSASGVTISGIIPSDEKKITSIKDYLIDGDYLTDTDQNSVLIGSKLAEQLDLKLKNKIVLSFQGLDSTIIYAAFRVSGIFRTESNHFNSVNVFVNQEDLFTLLNTESLHHEVAVKLKNSQFIPGVLQSLRNKLPQNKVEEWGEIAPEFKLTNDSMTISLNVFLGLILFGLFFGITNTMLMSVIDRVREIGILMAVGMKRIRIFIMIMTETILLSLSGGLAGMIFGSLTIRLLNSTGINLSSFSAGLGEYGIASMLYPRLPLSYYPVITIMIIVTAVFGAVYPSLKAIRLNPASAIRTY